MIDLKELIKNFKDYTVEKINIKQWPKEWDLHIRTLSSRQLNALTSHQIANPDEPMKDYHARVAIYCLCDKEGKLLFCENDIPTLSEKNGLALQEISRLQDKLSAKGPELLEANVKKLESNQT